jgi:hypothetical protein
MTALFSDNPPPWPPWLHDAAPYALALAGLIALWIGWRLLRRRKKVRPRLTPDLTVDLSALGERGPPPGPPVLEFYNLPVRLAAVVLAAVGPERELPPERELAAYLDSLVPGLDQVAATHKPLVCRWPNQVSARGFAHLFFSNARLPGLAGKGTPWSSVAGVFRLAEEPLMAGLVLCAAKPNTLGQTTIDAEHQWLGCLRVRWS